MVIILVLFLSLSQFSKFFNYHICNSVKYAIVLSLLVSDYMSLVLVKSFSSYSFQHQYFMILYCYGYHLLSSLKILPTTKVSLVMVHKLHYLYQSRTSEARKANKIFLSDKWLPTLPKKT